jgi:hypothetical protein
MIFPNRFCLMKKLKYYIRLQVKRTNNTTSASMKISYADSELLEHYGIYPNVTYYTTPNFEIRALPFTFMDNVIQELNRFIYDSPERLMATETVRDEHQERVSIFQQNDPIPDIQVSIPMYYDDEEEDDGVDSPP